MYQNIQIIRVPRRDLVKRQYQTECQCTKKMHENHHICSHVGTCRTLTPHIKHPFFSSTTPSGISGISPLFMEITKTKNKKNDRRKARRCSAWYFICSLICMLLLMAIGIVLYSIIGRSTTAMMTTTTETILTTITFTTTTVTTTTNTETTATTTTTTTTATTTITITTTTETIATTTATTAAITTTNAAITATTVITTTITTTIATTIATTSITTTTISSCGQPSCSISPDNTRYPNTCDCTKFYQCSNYVSYSFVCGAGLNFNPTVQVCDWPANVVCATG